MQKLVNKSDLVFDNGYITDESGNIWSIGKKVVEQLNDCELALQQTLYMESQPKAVKAPSMEGFKRQSIRTSFSVGMPETPLVDKKIEESMAMLEELDRVQDAKKTNQVLASFPELVEFLASERVRINDTDDIEIIDTPALGNPLELTPQMFVDILNFDMSLLDDEGDDEE